MSRIVKNAAFAMMAALSFITFPTCARAACGIYGMHGSKAAVKMPALPHADFQFGNDKSIVGLWHVIYTAPDQSTFNDTFDTWHSDGTEFESAFLAPAGGDVCVGVWKHTGMDTVRLHHVGWLFNPATPTANATNYFTLDEENTVAPNGKTYSGTFTFQIWNLDGTPTAVVVKGTIAATRITVD